MVGHIPEPADFLETRLAVTLGRCHASPGISLEVA